MSPSTAVGLVRVSHVGDRDADHFISPSDQRQRIAAWCATNGYTLVDCFEELDVSGGLELEKRKGLKLAMKTVRVGAASTIVVAYFDRLFRSLKVQTQVVDLVENELGGQIWAVDVGKVSQGTAAQRLQSTLLGAFAEYYRHSVGERTAEARERCIRNGTPPFRDVPLGYRLEEGTRKIIVEPTEAAVVRHAFQMRADGASWADLRLFFGRHGIHRSHHAVVKLIENRFVLGELHFGKCEPNLNSHEAIVDHATWERCQRRKGQRAAPGPASSRLLARQRVLRCATCQTSMTLGMQASKFVYYRCSNFDCPHRVTVGANRVEAEVSRQVQEILANEEETATSVEELRTARADLERAQVRLDKAMRLAMDMEDEDAARQMLLEYRSTRDEAREHVAACERLAGATRTLCASTDWDRLTLDERRELIRTVAPTVLVTAGYGPIAKRLEILR